MNIEKTSLSLKLNAILKLSRWRQHVPYTLPLVIAGALLAVTQANAALDWRLLAVVMANILAMTFAFMIIPIVLTKSLSVSTKIALALVLCI